jgi:hypothetical protein
MKKVRWLAALLLLVAFVGAACGDDDDSTVGSGSSSTTADDGGSSAKAPPEFTITASEDAAAGTYKFDVPKIAGGVVKVTLDNKGGKEVHDFQLVKLDGHKLDDLVKEVGDDSQPLSAWLKQGAGAGSTPPGGSSSAVFKLEPNTEYAYFCTESNEEKHLSHAQHGMAGTFTTGDDSGAAMPDGTATIETTEYKFKVDGLKAGKNTIAFTNKGTMLHHVVILPFRPGKTLDDLKTAFASEDQTQQPPVDFDKGVFSAVAGIGDTIVYDVDLPAGHYAILCFMPDPGTAGPPHMMKGMLQELTIS